MPLVKKWQLDEHILDPDIHHRKRWLLDEPTWLRNIVFLPVGGRKNSVGGSSPWARYAGNPILELSAGKWDDKELQFPCALRVGDERRIYYTGRNNNAPVYRGIGLATATQWETTNWTKEFPDSPMIGVGGAGDPDENGLCAGSVFYDDELGYYQCLYMGFKADGTRHLCRAYGSTDGKTGWTIPHTSVFQFPNNSDFLGSVCKLGKMYYAVYGDWDGVAYDLGLLVSNDATSWLDKGNILTRGGSGEADELNMNYGSIFWFMGTSYVFYMGRRTYNASNVDAICLALSWNFKDYTKWMGNVENPVYDVGSSGAWDDKRVTMPSLIYEYPNFYLVYTGFKSGSPHAIGLATMKLG